MNNPHEKFMNDLSESGAYNDEIEASIKAGIEEFKKTGTW
jgi:F0F1-type ATP synthase alpha subunit